MMRKIFLSIIFLLSVNTFSMENNAVRAPSISFEYFLYLLFSGHIDSLEDAFQKLDVTHEKINNFLQNPQKLNEFFKSDTFKYIVNNFGDKDKRQQAMFLFAKDLLKSAKTLNTLKLFQKAFKKAQQLLLGELLEEAEELKEFSKKKDSFLNESLLHVKTAKKAAKNAYKLFLIVLKHKELLRPQNSVINKNNNNNNFKPVIASKHFEKYIAPESIFILDRFFPGHGIANAIIDPDRGIRAIHLLATQNNKKHAAELLKWALNQPIDPYVKTISGRNILYLAVENENQEAIEAILESAHAIKLFLDTDTEGNTPLHILCDKEASLRMPSFDDSDEETIKRYKPMLELLIKFAYNHGIFSSLLINNRGQTPEALLITSFGSDSELIEIYKKYNLPLNENNLFDLQSNLKMFHEAKENNLFSAIKTLLAEKAEKNDQYKYDYTELIVLASRSLKAAIKSQRPELFSSITGFLKEDTRANPFLIFIELFMSNITSNSDEFKKIFDYYLKFAAPLLVGADQDVNRTRANIVCDITSTVQGIIDNIFDIAFKLNHDIQPTILATIALKRLSYNFDVEMFDYIYNSIASNSTVNKIDFLMIYCKLLAKKRKYLINNFISHSKTGIIVNHFYDTINTVADDTDNLPYFLSKFHGSNYIAGLALQKNKLISVFIKNGANRSLDISNKVFNDQFFVDALVSDKILVPNPDGSGYLSRDKVASMMLGKILINESLHKRDIPIVAMERIIRWGFLDPKPGLTPQDWALKTANFQYKPSASKKAQKIRWLTLLIGTLTHTNKLKLFIERILNSENASLTLNEAKILMKEKNFSVPYKTKLFEKIPFFKENLIDRDVVFQVENNWFENLTDDNEFEEKIISPILSDDKNKKNVAAICNFLNSFKKVKQKLFMPTLRKRFFGDNPSNYSINMCEACDFATPYQGRWERHNQSVLHNRKRKRKD
jgi:hypothetical protein